MTSTANPLNGKLWTAIITAVVCITGTGGVAYTTMPLDRMARVEEIASRNSKDLDRHLEALTSLEKRLSDQCAAMARIEAKLDAALSK